VEDDLNVLNGLNALRADQVTRLIADSAQKPIQNPGQHHAEQTYANQDCGDEDIDPFGGGTLLGLLQARLVALAIRPVFQR
jgi:hypothetical protein